MATIEQTPVVIVQELLAVHTTRKEAAEKAATKNEATAAAARHSDAAIAALMAELAQFGDGVGGDVPRDNAYQNLYKTFLSKDEALTDADFTELEGALKKTYDHILANQTDLPPTLQQLLQKQAAEL